MLVFQMCCSHTRGRLELNHLSLALLVTSQLEMLAALDGRLLAELALGALHTQHDLLGSLGL